MRHIAGAILATSGLAFIGMMIVTQSSASGLWTLPALFMVFVGCVAVVTELPK